MPVGCNHRKRYFWNSMVDKIRKKLAKWRRKVLSFVGRIVLLKSVIIALHLSYLFLFMMLVNVTKEVKRIQRDFLWGLGQDHKKIAWGKWDTLCKPKNEDDLGVRDLEAFNKALLGKWKWRMGTNKDGLWKEILESKYGS